MDVVCSKEGAVKIAFFSNIITLFFVCYHMFPARLKICQGHIFSEMKYVNKQPEKSPKKIPTYKHKY